MTVKSERTSKATARSTSGGDIRDYSRNLTPQLAAVCDALRFEIDGALKQADSVIWHGAPVWFLEGYPAVGYSLKARKIALLFWNGRALGEPLLTPVGKHFAAEVSFADVSELDRPAIRRCLDKAGKNVFKDYASLRARRGAKAGK
jgi:hypothetical protein